MHILVADDDKDVRDSTKGLLIAFGHTVVEVENGLLILAELARHNVPPPTVEFEGRKPYHAVVTDHDMPHMSGLEALRQIRSDERLAALPVVVITATANMRQKIEDLKGTYLPKPTDLEDFERVIDGIQACLD